MRIKNTNPQFGDEGPFEVESIDALVAEMTTTSLSPGARETSSQPDSTETYEEALARLQAEFRAGLEVLTIYTIPQKMSGTGSIHDLASDTRDRDIVFPAGHKYAIVIAAYYGGRGYTTHETDEDVIEADRDVEDYSRRIIDSEGNLYAIQGDELVRR